MFKRLSDVVHRRERKPLPLEPVEPVLSRVLGERSRDQRDQARPVRDAGRVGRKVRILDPLWVLQQVGELGELAVCAGRRIGLASDLVIEGESPLLTIGSGDHDKAIFCGQDLVRHDTAQKSILHISVALVDASSRSTRYD